MLASAYKHNIYYYIRISLKITAFNYKNGEKLNYALPCCFNKGYFFFFTSLEARAAIRYFFIQEK